MPPDERTADSQGRATSSGLSRRDWLAPIEQPALRYGAALLAVALALLLQRSVHAYSSPTPFPFAFGAVVFGAWFCGAVPTFAIIAAADLGAVAFFLPSGGAAAAKVIPLATFTMVSLFITLLGATAREGYRASRKLSTELALGEERWRSLAEAIPQIVWTADAQGRIDYQNARWLEYTGLTIEEASALGWPNTVHPEDLPVVLARWKDAVAGGQPYEVVSRIKRASDGRFRWFLSRGIPVRGSDGTIVKWFGTSTDVDEQRRSEDRATFLAEAGRQLASSLDYEATLQSMTRAAIPHFADWASVDLVEPGGAIVRVAVWHADPARVALAHELVRRYPPNPDDPTGLPNVLRTGKAELIAEIPDALLVQLIPDPELLAIVRGLGLKSSIVAPIVARGKTLGGISFVMAESGRIYTGADLELAEELGRRAGSALDNARLFREAQQASRMKDEFLSTLSHELRTPLTAILGWTHLLSVTEPTLEKVRRGVQVIERNARAQAQLVDDLLDVSRIVSGKMRLQVAEVDPIVVVQAALETVRPSAEARQVRLLPVLDPQAGPILGDADRLQQAVWNLLSNAIKFTPRDGRVQVRLARVDSHIEIAVTDTGVGIAPAFLPRVFERFLQADASVSREYGGLGLGLSIARQLAELHGGTIEAHSEGLGKGATFTIKLPLAPTRVDKPAADVHPAVSRREEPALAMHASIAGATVLVVEDAPDARDLLVEVLSSAGARVLAAASVAEALDVLSRETPDLLVSDIGMPGADGYELIRAVRAAGRRLPAIALTAYARAEDRRRSLVEGFDLHMAKPLDPGELVAMSAALLKRAR